MATKSVEQFATVAKDSADALTKSGNAAITGLTSLTKAYQDIATRNFEKLTASVQALASVKTPVEFFEIQQKLIKESLETTVADTRAIAELTTSVFTAAFEPVQKQIETLQNSVKKAA